MLKQTEGRLEGVRNVKGKRRVAGERKRDEPPLVGMETDQKIGPQGESGRIRRGKGVRKKTIKRRRETWRAKSEGWMGGSDHFWESRASQLKGLGGD